MCLVGLSTTQEVDQLVNSRVAAWTPSGRIDQYQVRFGKSIQCEFHLIRILNDLHGEVHDLSVGSKLLDSSNSKCVDGEQTDSPSRLDPESSCQFCNRSGLAYSGWTYEGNNPSVTNGNLYRVSHAELPPDGALKMLHPRRAACGRNSHARCKTNSRVDPTLGD
jgi:hypothetical protein